jgi:membrane fusion protein (multidrug efflux system)
MADPVATDVQGLHDEQIRLRTEIDLLRRQQEELLRELAKKSGSGQQGGDSKKEEGDNKQGEEKDQKGDGKEGKGEDGDPKGDKDKGDKDQGDKDKEEKDKPKEPLATRARNWAKAHPVMIVVGLIAMAALIVGGFILVQYLESYENTDDAEVDGHTNAISSRISGEVVGIYVEDTQHVAKGQVLVDLDPRDYKVAMAQAEANLAQAEASLRAQAPNVPITATSQEIEVRTANLDVAAAAASLAAAQKDSASSLADLQQAEANAAHAAREEERYRQLVGKQEVSREQYDQKATDARAQEALVASRRATADAAGRVVDQRAAAVDQARQRAIETQSNKPRNIEVQHATVDTRVANVKVAKAQLDQAVLNLSYCKIVAPTDGIIGDKTVETGQHLAPGQELFALTQTDDIWVTANFKETQIRNMHRGQAVTIQVDALSQKFDGFVEELPGATGAKYSLLPPENATGNYVKVVQRLPVRIRFKAGQPHAERLRPGMSVEPKVWIHT